jgi:hypothetical protein
MITANSTVFTRLAGEIPDLGVQLRATKRAIRTTEDEKKWLREVKFRTPATLRVAGPMFFAIAEYGERTYVLAVGIELTDTPDDLRPMVVNAGLLTAALAEIDVPINRSSTTNTELSENIFYPTDDPYVEYEVADVAKYFYALQAFEVAPESSLLTANDLDNRVGLAAVLGAPNISYVSWNAAARANLAAMARDPMIEPPFHLLIRALTENRNDAAFLSLYRCIEQLFPFPKIERLRSEMSISMTSLQISQVIEAILGWRNREDIAITELFEFVDATCTSQLALCMGIDENPVATGDQNGNLGRRVARRLYDIRNQSVHYRPIHRSEDAVTAENWIFLLEHVSSCVGDMYRHFTPAIRATDSSAKPVNSVRNSRKDGRG